MSEQVRMRALEVALDAKLSLASDPARFLRQVRLLDSWEPSEEEPEDVLGEGPVGESDASSSSLSLPESFDRELDAERLAALRGAVRVGAVWAGPKQPQPQSARHRDTEVEGQLRVELAGLRRQLEDGAAGVHCLEVSEAAYLELRARPEGSLSLRETALLRLGEALLPVRRELDRQHALCEEYRGALQTSSLTVEMQLSEMERQRRRAEGEASALALEKLSLEASNQGLLAQLEREVRLRQSNDEKAALFDAAAQELRQLRADGEGVRAALDRANALASALADGEAASRRALTDASNRAESLAQDKEHLSAEARDLRQRLETRERERDSCAARALGLEVRLQELTDQLLAAERGARAEFEERLERELGRLRDDSARELAQIRSSSRELAERENRVLREGRDAADAEVRRLQLAVERLGEGAAARERELQHQVSVRELELSQLRGEARARGYEQAALATAFEDRMGQLRQARAEGELLRDEASALRSALSQMERETDAQLARLTQELGAAKERLQLRAAWEQEVDARVEGGEVALPLDDRRVAHAVQLAQRLRASDARAAQLGAQVSGLEQELRQARGAAEAAARDGAHAALPVQYLVQQLRAAEEGAEQAGRRALALGEEARLQGERAALAERERDGLHERLELVLRQRDELDRLRRCSPM